jgi:hypothetical protein
MERSLAELGLYFNAKPLETQLLADLGSRFPRDASEAHRSTPVTAPGNSIYRALNSGAQWLVDTVGPAIPPELRGKLRGVGELLNMVNPATSYREYNASMREGKYGDAAMNAFGLTPGAALTAGAARIAGAAPSIVANAVPISVASRSPRMYNPPEKPARPFSADYPDGARHDPATGRLTYDIDGRPLTAERIVGRRVVGGGDQALAATQLVPLAEAATGQLPKAVASREQIGKDAGRYVVTRDRRSGDVLDRAIYLNRNLTEAQVPKVLAHEVGHAIDEIAGGIPIAGLNTEMRQLYNTLGTVRSARAS